MKIATTTGDFGRYVESDKDRITELHRAGFRYIDLNMYRFTPDCVYMREGWEQEALALKKHAETLGMQFVQAHSQGGNPLSDDSEHVDFLLKATIRSIEICQILGIKNTVVHNGYRAGINKKEWFNLNKAFFEKLIPTMERCGVNVLIENSTKKNMGDMYFVNTGKEMVEFIEYMNHPQFHACWDTGHANCEGSQYQQIMDLGEHLYAIHYNDNHANCDEHVIPYMGTLNHDEIINALIDVKFRGYFTLECDNSLISAKGWPHARRSFDKDTRLFAPQLFMQQKLESLMYEISKYMLSSYNLFEE